MSSSSSPSLSSQVSGYSGEGGGGRRRRRRGGRPSQDVGQASTSSSSFRGNNNEIWPEAFIEAFALQVAVDASVNIGRLAAAPAIVSLFQVCSTWRAVSRSELLWQALTRQIWNRTHLVHNSWHEEYIYHHRTSRNFRTRRYIHNTLHFNDAIATNDNDGDNNNNSLLCLRLTLSDHYLAAGFSDGSVRLFHLQTRHHLHTFRPLQRDRLGIFSRAVSGIVIDIPRVIFASLDGDIHVSMFNGGPGPTTRAHLGELVNDGTLVDFTGCQRFWVGLYAGVPGRAIHIWNSESQDLILVDGTLTDPEAVMGWHMLTELTNDFLGRVRVTEHELAVACTSLRVIVFDLQSHGLVLAGGEEDIPGGVVVGSVDASGENYVMVNPNGRASVRRVRTMEELCRFTVPAARGGGLVLGGMNSGYAVMCGAGGTTRVWDIEGRGDYLYSLRERIGECNFIVASDRHVAAAGTDGILHLWDFGAN